MSNANPSVRVNPRMFHSASAAAHLVIALAVGTLAITGASILLPIALSAPAVSPIGVFARVDFAAAAAIVMLIGAVAHAWSALEAPRNPDGRRARMLGLIAFAQASGITAFLIAQLNGVVEAGTLVLIYAVAAGAPGLLWLQAREDADRARARWPYSFAAGLAVVPWGIIALYQLVGVIAGSPPPPLVRVMTIVVLVIAALAWWIERRLQLGLLSERRAVVAHAAVSLATGVALVVLAAGLARPSAIF